MVLMWCEMGTQLIWSFRRDLCMSTTNFTGLACWSLGIQVEASQSLKGVYVSLPSQALRLYLDRARTGWPSIRIMWLGGISGHDTGSVVSQWGTFTSWCPSDMSFESCQDAKLQYLTKLAMFLVTHHLKQCIHMCVSIRSSALALWFKN